MKNIFKKYYSALLGFCISFIFLILFIVSVTKNCYNSYEKIIVDEIVEYYEFEDYYYVIEEVKNNNKYDYACYLKIYGNSKKTSINYVVRFIVIIDGEVVTERILYER